MIHNDKNQGVSLNPVKTESQLTSLEFFLPVPPPEPGSEKKKHRFMQKAVNNGLHSWDSVCGHNKPLKQSPTESKPKLLSKLVTWEDIIKSTPDKQTNS